MGSCDELRMHAQIQAMGRDIVMEESPTEPGKRSRLWSHDEISEVLEENKGTQMIEGILLFSSQTFPSVSIHRKDFEMMSNLRFLYIDEAHYNGDFLHLPSSLRWFSWRYPLEILPTNFYHKKIVHMDLSRSHFRHAWMNKPQNEKQLFQKLKVLHLRHCYHLYESPDFSWFPYLETLDLIWCKNMVKLHKSIGDLKSLVVLYLDETKIEELPNDICKLSSLKSLTLSQCSSLKNLPESIGDLKSLDQLLLDGTKIEELPNSICKLSSLKRLTLRSCSSLKTFPASIGDIKSLVQLSLDGTKIEELPYSICSLTSLKSLSLKLCSSLKKLPETIGDLTSLVELWLCGTKIEELPNSTCRLSSLERLDLDGCELLNLLPESIGGLNSLVELSLDRTKIEELPNGVGLLEKLKVLSIMGCENLVKLPISGGRMRCLRIINLIGTKILLSPDEFLMLHSLVELRIGNKFESSLPSWVSGLPQLQKVLLQGYTMLESVPKLPLTLTTLGVVDCLSLQKLPDLSSLKILRNLSLRYCEKLEEIRGLEGTESLEDLYVYDCDTITDTPWKINGQGKLLVDGLRRNDSLKVNDGIYKGLILCLVFAFTFHEQHVQENLQEGELVNIQLHLEASIRQKDRRTTCCNIGLLIKGIEFTTKRDLMYIHHFKGFDWFGLPLKGRDKIEGIRIEAELVRKGYQHRDFINCEAKFWKLLLESTESEQQMPDQESSARMVADFFKWWSYGDDRRSPSNIEGVCIVSVPSSYDDGESSCDEDEGSLFAGQKNQFFVQPLGRDVIVKATAILKPTKTATIVVVASTSRNEASFGSPPVATSHCASGTAAPIMSSAMPSYSHKVPDAFLLVPWYQYDDLLGMVASLKEIVESLSEGWPNWYWVRGKTEVGLHGVRKEASSSSISKCSREADEDDGGEIDDPSILKARIAKLQKKVDDLSRRSGF
ncbi:disease resistance protein RPV1-like [Telopea speciosissima]|uniref:disease resistance protein RPV1-like n=1 Tax=Telopea speciosissima TaxID=54955 RepID=UPI001CC8245C|nr:disease resistance protein RPV1-like [Telopea speciosissima]